MLVVLSYRSSFTHINIVFFCFLTIVFFSLNESVWSFAKYRLEVFIPLFISQVLFFLGKESSKRKIPVIVAIGIFGFSLNLNQVFDYPQSCSQKQGTLQNSNLRYKVDSGCNYLTRVPYNFSTVMSYLKTQDAMAETYIPGVYYGAFIHIVHGTRASDYLLSQKIWDDQKLLNSESLGDIFTANPQSIQTDSRINYVLLGFTKNSSMISSDLISKGWQTIYSGADKYGLAILLLRRPNTVAG